MAAPSQETAIWIGLCISILFCKFTLADDEFEGLSVLNLEHSFDQGSNPEFSRRGTITIRSLKAGSADYEDEGGLDNREKGLLEDVIQQDGIYRVRIRGRQSVENENHLVSTFIKACSLYESKLSDILTLNVDQMGSVLAISLNTVKPYCDGITISDKYLDHFNTTVDVIQTVVGPAPETQSYIQKMEQEQAEKAKGQQADNRSFLAKYWMYIVPVFILLMFANNADPQAQGGGGR